MDIVAKLRSEGYKVTPQRIAVFNAIYGNDEHPNAESIYRRLHPEYPSMSLATVYKTMEIFEKIGVVQVLHVGADANHYDYDTDPHPHVRCIVCGKVEDVEGIDLAGLQEQVEKASGYVLQGQQIHFYGRCAQCLKKVQ